MQTGEIDGSVEPELAELLQIVKDALESADDLELSIVAIHLQSALDCLSSHMGLE